MRPARASRSPAQMRKTGTPDAPGIPALTGTHPPQHGERQNTAMTIIPDHKPTTAEQSAAERADQLATDLGRFAAFLRTSPAVPARIIEKQTFRMYVMPGDDAKQQMADIIRAGKNAGGTVVKDVTDEYAGADIQFGSVTFRVYSDRNVVCERRVTGTRTVEVEEQDPEELAKVPTRTVTKTVEDVEWICTPILQADSTVAEKAGADA